MDISYLLLWWHCYPSKSRLSEVRDILRQWVDIKEATDLFSSSLLVQELGDPDIEKALGGLLEQLDRQQIQWIHCLSPEYPRRLFDLEDFPLALFYKGNVSLLMEPTISVVGTRQPSVDGKAMCHLMGAYLNLKNVVMVSGLAYGIDACMHQAILSGYGKTIAILPSGLTNITPRAHSQLADQILQHKGLLLSEMLPSESPQKFHFLKRNRLIAAISPSVVIIEAGINSGSLNTAEHAINLDRTIYAMPGSIRNPGARGTNQLIKECAIPFTTPEEITLKENPQTSRPQDSTNSMIQSIWDGEVVSSLEEDSVNALILRLLKTSNLMSLDEISQASKLSIDKVLPYMLDLVLEQRVIQIGNYFKCIN